MAMTDSPFDNSASGLAEVLDFLSKTYGSYHSLRNWSLGRMSDWKYGGNCRFDRTDPDFFSRNMHLWRDGSRILGVAVSERGEAMSLQVGRDERLLEERMLEWTETVWGQGKDRIVVLANANDAWRQSVLRKRGYREAEECGFLRRYDTSLTPHQAPLPKGFSISDLAHSKNADGFVEVVSKAFAKPFIDKEWLESRRKAPGHMPGMAVQVLSSEGRCVSYAEARIDWKQNYAEIDPIATHPDFQRMGLARACLAESFKRLAAMGVRDAYIGSAVEPATSDRLYDSMLPVEKVEEFSWELTR